MLRPKWKQARAIIKSLQAGSSYFAAAKAANISWCTFYAWKKSIKGKLGKTFGELTQQIWDSRVENVEDAHYALAMRGNYQAQQFFLTNRASLRYRKDPEAQFINNVYNGIKVPSKELPPMQRVYVGKPDEIPS
jgi:hypothetical protein